MTKREYVAKVYSGRPELIASLTDTQIDTEYATIQRGNRKLQAGLNVEVERNRFYVNAVGAGNECS